MIPFRLIHDAHEVIAHVPGERISARRPVDDKRPYATRALDDVIALVFDCIFHPMIPLHVIEVLPAAAIMHP